MSKQSPSAYQTSDRDQANLNQPADYSSIESLPEIWSLAAQRFSDIVALRDPHAQPEVVITYAELYQQIQQFAAGLQAKGVPPASKVSLFADNSPRWLIADQGIMMAGAVDVVRSSQAAQDELLYILSDSDSTSLVVEDNKTLQKLRSQLHGLPIELVVLLSDEAPEAEEGLTILNFEQLMAAGEDRALQPVAQNRETLATLLYTSGTGGNPKPVMLSHDNLMHQVRAIPAVIQPQPGDRALSILPSWHAYERSCEYFLLSLGCTQIYTNLRAFKKDLKQFQPHYMVGVPRLWESIYETIQKQFREQPANKQRLVNFLLGISQRQIIGKRVYQGLYLDNLHPKLSQRLTAGMQAATLLPLHALAERLVYKKVREATGGKLKTVINGGGALARHIDDFYEIIGVPLLVGYGLTETSPVTNARRPWHNLRGSSGQPLPETEVQIVNPETRQPLAQGEKGLVMIRGSQVMQGYYKKPEATAKAIDAEGWFDTGDLGWLTPTNDLVLTGRAKDTIVLSNGENIEPLPLENACARSPYIDQIMVVGQDQRSLGALIVPNLEVLKQWEASQEGQGDKGTRGQGETPHLESKPVQNLFRQELNREVQNRPGYRPDDRIGTFKLILEPFSVENGMMTQTLKIKRPVVSDRYSDLIEKMFEKQ
ncbi:MAG: long-chain fatty acid--CoA ligase [Cyanobacteria bacterium SW_11_48_12]|nr:MAG: long-chain fatty acid--CoA ligase [Cyanobacteria bacterium SW_11_48_12]